MATRTSTFRNLILHRHRATSLGFVRSVSKTSNSLNPPADDNDLLPPAENLRLAHSFEPVPFSSDIELSPRNNSFGAIGHKKITVVGCGQVGMAIAYSMLNQSVAGTIALVDMNRDKLEGEAKDLEQGSAFHQYTRILASDEYSVSANSHLVIVTAGAAQKPGESRLDLVTRNIPIMQNIIPKVLTFSPNAVICIVANPCDLMTAISAKIAGASVPPGRIFGSGTCLDSSRLRSLISKKMDLDTSSVSGFVIGEHGDTSVPVWSSVRIGGVPLLKNGQNPTKVHDDMHREVVDSAYDVINKKGYTNWAVGLTNAHIAKAVVTDTRMIMPVSTCVRGMKGVENDVFVSMPAAIGSTGVVRAQFGTSKRMSGITFEARRLVSSFFHRYYASVQHRYYYYCYLDYTASKYLVRTVWCHWLLFDVTANKKKNDLAKLGKSEAKRKRIAKREGKNPKKEKIPHTSFFDPNTFWWYLALVFISLLIGNLLPEVYRREYYCMLRRQSATNVVPHTLLGKYFSHLAYESREQTGNLVSLPSLSI
eukprot:scaffold3463_cov96-Cylindrotheca_fusiformis.AAC.2